MQLEKLMLDADASALDGMRRLEETGRRIVFVAPEGRLQAVLTDSDIRKFILRGGDLSAPVGEAANQTPKSLPMERRGEAKALMERHSIEAVPLLDKNGVIVDVAFLNDLGGVQTRKLLHVPVVIMAGGLGTRLYPYTKILPKPLIPVGEEPIIEHVIHSFTTFGSDDFTLILNHKRNMIKSYFADIEKSYTLRFIDEEEPLGTGGGLCLLKGSVKEPFFLTNCDTLLNADYGDIVRFHQKQGNVITMVCAAKQFTIPYGVVELAENGELAGISEKPKMNYLTNTGVYLVEPRVVEEMEDGVVQGFPDVIEACRARGQQVGVYPVGEDSWMDIGQLEELDAARRRLEEA